jgi:hypothetical protein
MCGLCEVLDEVLVKIERLYPSLTVYKLNQEEDLQLFEKFEIDGVPTLYMRRVEGFVEIPYPETGYQYEYLKDYFEEVYSV